MERWSKSSLQVIDPKASAGAAPSWSGMMSANLVLQGQTSGLDATLTEDTKMTFFHRGEGPWSDSECEPLGVPRLPSMLDSTLDRTRVR